MNGFDLIDLVGPGATRQDYEAIAEAATELAESDELWNEDGTPNLSLD